VLVGRYFAYVTTNSVSEFLLRGHESRSLLVESLEFIVKLASELSGHSRYLVLLGALGLHFLEFFLSSDGLSDFSSQKLASVALLPEAVVDVFTVHTNPIAYTLGGLLLLLGLVVLSLVVIGSEFVNICLNC
jgi:hypothetical protein